MSQKKLIDIISKNKSFLSNLRICCASSKQSTTSNTYDFENARPYNEIPTESSFQVMRNFLPGGKYYKMDLNQMNTAIQKKFGDIFRWPPLWGKPEIVFTHNPVDFAAVYRNEGVWPRRPGLETLAYFRSKVKADFFKGTDGVLTTDGEPWSTFRSTVNPVLMHPKIIKRYLDKLSDVNMDFIKRIRHIRDPNTLEMPDNFLIEINSWTLESVAVIALDKRLGLLQDKKNPVDQQFFRNITETLDLFFELEVKPSLWRVIATPKFKRLMKLLDEVRTTIFNHVSDSIERLEKEQKQGIERPEHEKSVLEKLLKIDKKIATVMAMDMLLAGVDTTSSTFTGVLFNLAKNPEKQQKLREEVLKILPNKDSDFDSESLNHIPYLKACIKESMRIYPLATGNLRVLENDVVLSGYRVPKDVRVVMCFQTLLRNVKYFPQPNEYIPERWLRTNNTNSANNLRNTNPFLFLPFGFGPRMCLGKRVADLELEIAIARLVRNFQIEFNYSLEKAFRVLIFNVPNIPLKFKFTDI